MPAIAIVGAGPGLGLSIAKVFGGQGFGVALVSRSKDKLEALVAQLAASGVTAAAFPADVADRPALTAALEQAAARFGAVDVLDLLLGAALGRVPLDPPERRLIVGRIVPADPEATDRLARVGVGR